MNGEYPLDIRGCGEATQINLNQCGGGYPGIDIFVILFYSVFFWNTLMIVSGNHCLSDQIRTISDRCLHPGTRLGTGYVNPH